MAHQKDPNDIKVPLGPIPEGWTLLTELKSNGSEVQCYYCPRTEQRFYSYEDLVRHVMDNKADKLSTCDPTSEADLKLPEGCVAVKREGQSSTLNTRKRKAK